MIIEPQLFGAPLYPGGFPLQAKKISVQGRTVEEIYYKGIDLKTGRSHWNAEDEETLKSFFIYYLKAPVFYNELTAGLLQKNLMEINFSDLYLAFLDIGLDPL